MTQKLYRFARGINVRALLDVVVTIMVLVASGMVIWRYGRADSRVDVPAGVVTEIPAVDIPFGSATIGKASAPVGIVIFSDFECPYCRRFAVDILPDIQRELVDTGLARLAFRHFPLEAIHPSARGAAEVAACAAEVGQFWIIHDLMFAPASLQETTAQSVVRLNLNRPDYVSSCLEGRGREVVDEDLKQGRRLGVTGTPAFFIGKLNGDRILGTRHIQGGRPVEYFRRLVAEIADGR